MDMITIFNNWHNEQLQAMKMFFDNSDGNLVYFERYKGVDENYANMFDVLSQLNEELTKRGLSLKY